MNYISTTLVASVLVGSGTGLHDASAATVPEGVPVTITWPCSPGKVKDYRLERSSDGGQMWGVLNTVEHPKPCASPMSTKDTTYQAPGVKQYRYFARGENLLVSLTPSQPCEVTVTALPVGNPGGQIELPLEPSPFVEVVTPPVPPPVPPPDVLTAAPAAVSITIERGKQTVTTLILKKSGTAIHRWEPTASMSWLWLMPTYGSQNTIAGEEDTLALEIRGELLTVGLHRADVFIWHHTPQGSKQLRVPVVVTVTPPVVPPQPPPLTPPVPPIPPPVPPPPGELEEKVEALKRHVEALDAEHNDTKAKLRGMCQVLGGNC